MVRKMQLKTKLFSAFTAAAIAVSTASVLALPSNVNAETDTRAIQLGSSALTGVQTSNVYFGNYWQTSPDTNGPKQPIRWNVLSNNGNNVSILSENILSAGVFNDEGYDKSDWLQSDARNWCFNNFFFNAFSSDEQLAIPSVDLYGTGSYDVVYLPSNVELNSADNGFLSDASRSAYMLNFAMGLNEKGSDPAGSAAYWTRDCYMIDYNDAAGTSGYLYGVCDSDVVSGYRPETNLDTEYILFTSSAYNGKVTGANGTLSPVGDAEDNDYKLTVKGYFRNITADVDGNDFVTAEAGDTIDINYSGLLYGKNEFMSAFITDEYDNVLYYGHLKTGYNGVGKLTIPEELPAGDYTLKIFNEQCNGDYETDYASDFVDISLTVEGDQDFTFDSESVCVTYHLVDMDGYDVYPMNINGIDEYIDVPVGTLFHYTEPTSDDFTFIGLYKDPYFSEGIYGDFTLYEDTDIYVCFSKNPTVTYHFVDMDGYSVEPMNINGLEEYTNVPVGTRFFYTEPTSDDFTFIGLYKDPYFSEGIYGDFTLYEDTDIYVCFAKNPTVTYHFVDKDGNAVDPMNINGLEEYTNVPVGTWFRFPAPTADDFTCLGIYKDSYLSEEITSDFMLEEDADIYVVWEADNSTSEPDINTVLQSLPVNTNWYSIIMMIIRMLYR